MTSSRVRRSPIGVALALVAMLVAPNVADAWQPAPNGFRPAPLHPDTYSLPARDSQPSTEFRQRFLAASHNRDRLTLDEARRAGLTQLVRDFPAIDVRHRGTITIAQLRDYLAAHPDDPISRDEGNL